MPRALLAALAVLALGVARPAAADDLRLLMLEEKGCPWCLEWEAEVGDAYHLTEEGGRAPLMRHSIHEPLPAGVTLARRAHFTPTFVLLEDGTEVGRIEGYPGEDFFYALLGKLFRKADAPGS